MKIIIGIDGSKQSDAALEACAKFIKTATQIKIMSVVEQNYLIGAEPFAVSAEFYTEVQNNEKNLAKANLKKAEHKLREIFSEKETEIVTEISIGNPSQIIVNSAETWKADLIIVGSHGYGFWERAMIGSVSDSVIHHSPCSVLVVK